MQKQQASQQKGDEVAKEDTNRQRQALRDKFSRRIEHGKAIVPDRPGHGMVPPDRFNTVLEETGLILPVGAWVIRTACRQLAEWDRTASLRDRLDPRASLRVVGHA